MVGPTTSRVATSKNKSHVARLSISNFAVIPGPGSTMRRTAWGGGWSSSPPRGTRDEGREARKSRPLPTRPSPLSPRPLNGPWPSPRRHVGGSLDRPSRARRRAARTPGTRTAPVPYGVRGRRVAWNAAAVNVPPRGPARRGGATGRCPDPGADGAVVALGGLAGREPGRDAGPIRRGAWLAGDIVGAASSGRADRGGCLGWPAPGFREQLRAGCGAGADDVACPCRRCIGRSATGSASRGSRSCCCVSS
jgi:hypothetical protein